MICLALLLSTARADDYWKTICVCIPGKCQSSNRCNEQPTLDPTSSTFIEDLNYARKNIKNVVLYFDSYSSCEIELNMQDIAGLTLNVSSYFGIVDIKFHYVNGVDYGGNIFNFDSAINPSFIPIEDSKDSNVLIVNTINAADSDMFFYKNGDKLTSLQISSISISTSALLNISKLYKNKIGLSKFKIGENDKVEIKFSKDLPSFMINGTNLVYNYIKGDSFELVGQFNGYSHYNDTLKITLEDGVSYSDIPKINFGYISKVILSGKFSPPSETNPISNITKIGILDIPSGDFPFSIYSDSSILIFNGDTTIYGDIDAPSWYFDSAYMSITTNLRTKVNVSFKGYMDSELSIESPYINLHIDNYIHNNTYLYSDDFPISFSFNEESASYVYIKNISFYYTNVTYANTFACWPTIVKSYTDEALDSNKILKGFDFIDLPKGVIDSLYFYIKIDRYSPSASNQIPGFMVDNNCMSISSAVENDRLILKAKKTKTAYGTPSYICITDGSRCDYPEGVSSYPYKDITSDYGGDLSDYILEGYKKIYIASTITSNLITINVDKLKGKDYEFSVFGTSNPYARTSVDLKSTNGKIIDLTLGSMKLSSDFDFDMNSIKFRDVTFDGSKRFTFGSKTKVIFDTVSLDSILKISNNPTFGEIYFEHNYDLVSTSTYSIVESIEFSNRKLEICEKYYSYDKSCVSNINPKSFTKINYISGHELTISSNSMDKDLIPINISLQTSISNFYLTLTGDGWSTELDNKINIDHGKSDIVLYVSKPSQGDNLNIVGSGNVLFKVDYGDTQKACFYDINNKDTCKDQSLRMINIPLEKSSDLKTINNNSVLLYIDNSPTKTPFQIPLSFFNLKQVDLDTPWRQENSIVEINVDTQTINALYSLTNIMSINLTYTNDTDVTVNFGQLTFDSSTRADENFANHVTLKVSQLLCTYKQLYFFKNITVADQLNVTGDVQDNTDEKVIDFVPNEVSNDLVAEIYGNVTIENGKGYVKVGKLIFKISHSTNYDAYFKVSGDSNITIISKTSDANEFMKFVLKADYYTTINITFIGDFPTIGTNDQSLIKIDGANRINITTSSNLPISIVGVKYTDFHLLTKDINVIHGPISYKAYRSIWSQSTEPNIKFFNHQTEKLTINIPMGYVIEDLNNLNNFTAIMNSTIDLVISKISKTSYYNGNITFLNTISSDGSSSVTIGDKLPNGVYLHNMTYLYAHVFGKIEDEQTFPLIKSNITIIKAKYEDVQPITIDYKYIVDNGVGLTHGFYPGVNCLKVKQLVSSDSFINIQLYAYIMPSQIPFFIDFVTNGTDFNSELVIDDSNMDDLNDLTNLLPKVFVGIVMRLHRNMILSKPLNLDNIIKGRDSLTVSIQSIGKPYEAYVTIPSSKVLSMTFTNVKLGLINSKQYLSKFVNFTDCEFLNAQDFVISNEVEEIHMDVDSFNGLAAKGSLSSYKKKMNVNSANVILFTKDGWEFREDRSRSTVPIKANEFPNIEFSTDHFCMLVLEDESLAAIKSFKFSSIPDKDGIVLFELSRHWKNIKDLGGFTINVNGAEKVNLNTASYPIPNIFAIDSSKIAYTFETDVSGKFDTLTLEENKVFKDETLTANFQYLPDEFQYIDGDKVTFQGSDQVAFSNDVGTLRVNESIFGDKSVVTFSNLETLRRMSVGKGSTLTGKFKFSLSSTLQLR